MSDSSQNNPAYSIEQYPEYRSLPPDRQGLESLSKTQKSALSQTMRGVILPPPRTLTGGEKFDGKFGAPPIFVQDIFHAAPDQTFEANKTNNTPSTKIASMVIGFLNTVT